MIKKIKWSFLAIIAALSMASCSSDEPGKGQDENDGGDVKYLAVQIVTPTASGSRADSSTSNDFEKATAEEDKVDKVRFYFFTDGGNPANVKKIGESYVNYYDWPDKGQTIIPSDGDIDDNPSTSRILNAMLIIDPENGDKLPNMVVAVVNPDLHTNNPNPSSTNLSSLRGKYSNYAAEANKEQYKGQTVMCNSVYIDGSEIINSTRLSLTDFKTSSAEAISNPVEIYVERNVAKVRAKDGIPANDWITLSDGEKLLKAKNKDNNPITTESGNTDTEVYIKVGGWHVTTTLQYSSLSKFISKSWTNIFSDVNVAWNDPTNKRSYWALSDRISNNHYQHLVNWNDIEAKKINGTNVVYVNENAGFEDTNAANFKPTVVIVAATLCDATGKPLTICEYAGKRFVDNDELTGLKGDFLSFYHNIGHVHFRKVTDNGVDKYRRITNTDIVFKQDTEADNDRYYVYAALSDDAFTNGEWYTYEGDIDKNQEPDENVIKALKKVTDNNLLNECLKKQVKALVYKSGRTYYYAPIKQYNLDGVVRNHIYDIIIEGFYGLGTPAFDDEWNIIPERPNPTEAYLAARINILSWHAMTQHVTFD